VNASHPSGPGQQQLRQLGEVRRHAAGLGERMGEARRGKAAVMP